MVGRLRFHTAPSAAAPGRASPRPALKIAGRSPLRTYLTTTLLLAACGQSEQATNTAVPTQPKSRKQVVALDDGRIRCARGDAPMERNCTVEQVRDRDGMVLTLRHPDGGFRRLRVATDGRGVVAADGAQPAAVTVTGPGDIEVAVGGDRYRLPATVKPR